MYVILFVAGAAILGCGSEPGVGVEFTELLEDSGSMEMEAFNGRLEELQARAGAGLDGAVAELERFQGTQDAGAAAPIELNSDGGPGDASAPLPDAELGQVINDCGGVGPLACACGGPCSKGADCLGPYMTEMGTNSVYTIECGGSCEDHVEVCVPNLAPTYGPCTGPKARTWQCADGADGTRMTQLVCSRASGPDHPTSCRPDEE